MTIKFEETTQLEVQAVKALYDDVKWSSYTSDLPRLMEAIKCSLKVITAWDNGKLVGLIRVVGDGKTIIYIQDILVLRAYHNKGIGSQLLKLLLSNYKDVRQKVLLTNDAADVRTFYEKHGFSSCDKGDLVSFAKFD
ncbi:GNAT family N-acetyltransferase [Bacillus sp. V2I10]|uniref:GNAT family N-acetyltransferase n=1 Tax=Bacillus sp. V2I10 TaxID=3042276 RepID=UPI00278720DB|nr:GNAT family N-acetyltransferase [Bacillus sp. V2I10]MDQ0858809.1 GNAT superfamily N-acetyltransferase [Bacillus sp. V2I10]